MWQIYKQVLTRAYSTIGISIVSSLGQHYSKRFMFTSVELIWSFWNSIWSIGKVSQQICITQYWPIQRILLVSLYCIDICLCCMCMKEIRVTILNMANNLIKKIDIAYEPLGSISCCNALCCIGMCILSWMWMRLVWP